MATALSKSIIDWPLALTSASPRSAWSLGVKSNLRGSPQPLPCWTLLSSSSPSGTPANGRFGKPSRMLSSSVPSAVSCSPICSIVSLAVATSARRRSNSASSPLALALPISLELALRALSASCLAVLAARSCSSRARMDEIVSSPSPAFLWFQAALKASGFSRIARRSNMA